MDQIIIETESTLKARSADQTLLRTLVSSCRRAAHGCPSQPKPSGTDPSNPRVLTRTNDYFAAVPAPLRKSSYLIV
jgi:hypothetical protein